MSELAPGTWVEYTGPFTDQAALEGLFKGAVCLTHSLAGLIIKDVRSRQGESWCINHWRPILKDQQGTTATLTKLLDVPTPTLLPTP